MHRIKKITFLLVLVGLKLATAQAANTESIHSKEAQLAVNTPLQTIYEYQNFFNNKKNMSQLLAPSPRTRYLWQNMSRLFKTEMVLRNGPISYLPEKVNPKIDAIAFRDKNNPHMTVKTFFDHYPMDAMIVIHHGVIVDEHYKTMRSFDKHNWFSVGKTIAGTLTAILQSEGKIDVKKPVSFYLPKLKGSVWDSVPVIDVLNMTTGLNATEHEEPNDDAHTNPERGWYQWVVSLGVFNDSKNLHQSPITLLRNMKRDKAGNTVFEYNSIDTWVLELIIERVTGKPLNEVFGHDVWRKIGAQADGYIAISPDGYPIGWGLMSSTLRDLARFGLIFTPSWHVVSSQRIISKKTLQMIQHSGNPAIFDDGFVGRYMISTLHEKNLTNGYQWDVIFPDGDLFKAGVGGQGLYVSPSRDLVIAWFSTGESDEQIMARAIALYYYKKHKK
ncbi:MAG: hypothetical protein COY58_01890 [Gammaproteobacteria bacterium CG_4_10_14_0_8_um_filter_38_16]|nr:MAG: hypothetical protein COY58_01890 [Gammaproteobacteria bacterium CG_4_10_14_0_8_um_filter_38_16]PJA04066.1 MAG: hypothetical protein COX72_01675 [Gammaproteobacteria bacterium CG_4_10_14_0_2_um_filter_38_22]PJB10982.1 MAG: hypothetical protein CO120_02010 [Gammaproteobacteria bacterium CG_4_9_14_3_um_filter_38_9]